MTTSKAGSETELQSRGKALYDFGSTILYSSKTDARFPFCLYVPPDIHEPGPAPQLVVTMHGTGRNVTEYRDTFAEFGRWNRCVILSPLFPAGVHGDRDRDGFKYMLEGDIRYDQVLLGMVEEVEQLYDVRFPRFALWGFSGGGHFVHRFFLLHPHRLWAVTIGAPGSVTQIDSTRDWWVGTRDMTEIFGIAPDLEAMRRVAVHMVVGDADRETWEITHKPGARRWMEGANDAGATRPDRLETLRRNFAAHGIEATLELVPGVSHDWRRMVPRVQNFFARTLRTLRADAEGQAA
jgi:dienelactone hydrolase